MENPLIQNLIDSITDEALIKIVDEIEESKFSGITGETIKAIARKLLKITQNNILDTNLATKIALIKIAEKWKIEQLNKQIDAIPHDDTINIVYKNLASSEGYITVNGKKYYFDYLSIIDNNIVIYDNRNSLDGDKPTRVIGVFKITDKVVFSGHI